MSTTTPPRSSSTLAQDHERIASPLAKLRKFIAGYVSLEGATVVALFVALWFWIGLMLDYGAFRLFLLDWVQWLPMWLRGGLLGAVLLALVVLLVLVVVVRLFVHFTDAALALVLERRFPEKLGDRLITAVELADPQQAAAVGYSPQLVRETIREAASRVDEVPVKEVFDWRRLVLRGLLFVALTVGLYLLVGAGFCAARVVQGEGSVMTGYGELTDVSRIWFERNVLLRNTIWPRKAHLELVDFPDDLRIAANTTPPSLRVRAWKYVVADKDAAEGWRLLRWADLTGDQRPAGLAQAPALPEAWKPRESYGITVDEVEQALGNFPVRTSLPDGTALPAKYCTPAGEEYRAILWSDLTTDKLAGVAVPSLPALWDLKAGAGLAAGLTGLVPGGPLGAAGQMLAPAKTTLTVDEVAKKLTEEEAKDKKDAKLLASVRAVVDRLELLASIQRTVDAVDTAASDRANRRAMRKLIVPSEVMLTYGGKQTQNKSTLTPVAGNEFTGNFSELKETITFRVRGEDYETPRQTIVVVERPRVERIESQEERPAYLYYRENGELTSTFLRDHRQALEPTQLQATSDLTNFDVPTGTHVTLSLTMNKPIKSGTVVPDQQFANLYAGEELKVEGNKISLRIPNLRREQRFTIQYLDEDEVPGERKVIILPREDIAPRIREFAPDEIVGKPGKEGIVVSATARVPFKGRVNDDRGLARVRFACRVTPADYLGEQKIRSLLLAGAVPLAAPGFGAQLQSVAYVAALKKDLDALGTDEGGYEQFLEIPGFLRDMTANKPGDKEPLELLPFGEVKDRLAGRRKEPYRQLFRELSLSPDGWMSKFAPDPDDDKSIGRWIRADDTEGRDPKAPLYFDLPIWKLKYRHVEKDAEGKVLVDELRSIVARMQPRRKDLKEGEEPPQRRFIVEVRLVAEDNFATGDVDPATKKPIAHTTSSDTHTFVVVPTNEVISRIAADEDQLYRDLVKTVKPINDAVDRTREMTLYLSSSNITGAELNNFRARTVDIIDGLQGAHQDAKAVYQSYEQILKKLRLNQVDIRDLTRVYHSIFKPLQEAALSQFDAGINDVKALKATLDDETRPVAARVKAGQSKAKDARDTLMDLQKNINQILSAMEGLSKLNELVAEIVRIERAQEDLQTLWLALYRIRFDEQFKKGE